MNPDLQTLIDSSRLESLKVEQEWLAIKTEVLPKLFALRNRLNRLADEIDQKRNEEKCSANLRAPICVDSLPVPPAEKTP